MEANISAEVIKEKSYDPNFIVRVSYDDGKIKFKNEMVSVSRRPPRVNIEYPESIKHFLDKINIKKLELEIMKAILETLLGSSGKRL
ncbi:MAG TPA: hypothetical protein GX501_06605 [Clostridiaceae bacterium]|nr:hypothetical protein [Clostridiaceae bacterium]